MGACATSPFYSYQFAIGFPTSPLPLLKEKAIAPAQEGDQGLEVGCSQKLKGLDKKVEKSDIYIPCIGYFLGKWEENVRDCSVFSGGQQNYWNTCVPIFS